MTKKEARAKVAKLRALAQSANPHEAHLANIRASELVEKYDLGPDTGMFSDPPYGLGTIRYAAIDEYAAKISRRRTDAFDAAIWADIASLSHDFGQGLANFADELRRGMHDDLYNTSADPDDPDDPPK